MEILVQNKVIQVLVVFIVIDVVFGILRSFKQHKTNSTIGIDGIVRKVAMMFTIACCVVLDYIVEIDLIGFIPEQAKEVMHLGRIGTSVLFAFLYCIFEVLSIFTSLFQ